MIVEGLPPLPALTRPRIQKIAELAYGIDPKSSAGSKITENHSSIPPFTFHFPTERSK
jgi:hypothetical protein